MPAISSARSVRAQHSARRIGDRKHHRLGGDDPAPAVRPQLGLAERRMPETAQVADLVQSDRLEIVLPGLAAGDDRPRECRVEKDVGLDDFAGGVVDEDVRRGEHAVQLRVEREPERGLAVFLQGLGGREPDELICDGRGRHRLPGGERPADRRLEGPAATRQARRCRSRNTGRAFAPISAGPARRWSGRRTSNRPGLARIAPTPSQTGRARPAGVWRASVRSPRTHENTKGRSTTHRCPPARARTRCSNSGSGIGLRAGSPRTTLIVPLDGDTSGGGVTSHPRSRSASTRNTPCPRPSR